MTFTYVQYDMIRYSRDMKVDVQYNFYTLETKTQLRHASD